MPGPPPKKDRRGRNPLAFPTTRLPAGGRSGPIPKVPAPSVLGEAGRAWWRWAWRTPQSAAWNAGDVQTVVRRAQLADAWHAMVVDGKPTASMANTLRQHDEELGLTPAGMQHRRWEILPEDQPVVAPEPDDGGDDEVARRRIERQAAGLR